MEKRFRSENAYERWDRRNKSKGTANYFEEERPESYLKDLKGRVQNNLSGILRVILTGLLILLQFVIVLLLPFILRNLTVYFYVILEVCSIIAIITLVNKNQIPSFRIAWISVVVLLPISGFVFYLLWGRKTNRRKRLDRHIMRCIHYGNRFLVQDDSICEDYVKKNPVAGRMVKYMVSEGFTLTKNNRVKFYSMGEDAFEDIFQAMEKAENFIFLYFFIVAEGALWDKTHEILKRKLKEGVQVFFLYDDFGASTRTRNYFKQILEHEGMKVHVFNPIMKYTGQLYVNYRTHQKIVVVDGKVGFTGGFNLADEYANLVERFGVWKDSGVRLVGDAVWNLTVVFLQMWEAASSSRKHVDYLKYKVDMKVKGDTYCQVISDGPANNPKNPISSIYNQMINFSDEILYITTPYLILEDSIRQSLVEAVGRGVDVRIVTPNIPDKKYAKLLTNYNYGALLRAGVRIFEYTPGFIHAKQILTENAAIVGTINMDYRSFYLHYENAVWMSGKQIQADIRKDFDSLFAIGTEVTYKEWLNRPRRWKMVQPVLNLFSTLF